jgi:hypothetical protein
LTAQLGTGAEGTKMIAFTRRNELDSGSLLLTAHDPEPDGSRRKHQFALTMRKKLPEQQERLLF